jgi:hypothetical protein
MVRYRGPYYYPYYSPAWRLLYSHYNGLVGMTLTGVIIALHRGLYLAIIMVRYRGPLTTLTIALHRGVYLGIIIDPYERPLNALTLALYRGLHIAIIMDRYKGPSLHLL